MTSENNWKVFGFIVLALLSALLAFPEAGFTLLIPAPSYIEIFSWFVGYFAFLLVPFSYLVHMKYAGKSPRYFSIVLILAIAFGILNIAWLFASWDYGVAWQGDRHTTGVTIISGVSLLLVIGIATWAFRVRTRSAAHSASLSLFLFLAWSAFPYLGERL